MHPSIANDWWLYVNGRRIGKKEQKGRKKKRPWVLLGLREEKRGKTKFIKTKNGNKKQITRQALKKK